jgi:membrane-anchored protein YejM (alkaline phosphatase superfamily)
MPKSEGNGGVCHYVEPNGSNPLTLPDRQAKIIRAGYAGAVTFVDGQVGKVMDQLEALGHRDDTIVAFWAGRPFSADVKICCSFEA